MVNFLFIIAFGLCVQVISAGVLAVCMRARLAQFYPYVWSIARWAMLGVLAANTSPIGLFGLEGIYIDPPQAGASPAYEFARITWALVMEGGPLLMTALGWLAGCGFGVLLAFLQMRRLPDAPRPD